MWLCLPTHWIMTSLQLTKPDLNSALPAHFYPQLMRQQFLHNFTSLSQDTVKISDRLLKMCPYFWIRQSFLIYKDEYLKKYKKVRVLFEDRGVIKEHWTRWFMPWCHADILADLTYPCCNLGSLMSVYSLKCGVISCNRLLMTFPGSLYIFLIIQIKTTPG